MIAGASASPWRPTTPLRGLIRSLLGLLPLLLLHGCFIEPGQFASSLDIRADRSFTFAYQGEIIVSDPSEAMKSASGADWPNDDDGGRPGDDSAATARGIAFHPVSAEQTSRGASPRQTAPGVTAPDAAAEKQKTQRMEAIAAALRKEQGYRAVDYLGGNKFRVDYAISGRLDHSFLFPFNIDAQAILPFVAVELRTDGKVRVLAPAFGNAGDNATPGAPGGGQAKERNGSFTLTTDAAIVSQNQEDGATDTPQGKRIVWTVTPLTQTPPMAVLQFPHHP